MGILFSFFGSTPEVDMEGDKALEVKEIINSDKVVIFSKTYCPYCTMAKKVFDSINRTYTLIELDQRDDSSVIQAILGKLTGAQTVPRVFVNGQCVGGGTDVKRLHEEGKLVQLLA